MKVTKGPLRLAFSEEYFPLWLCTLEDDEWGEPDMVCCISPLESYGYGPLDSDGEFWLTISDQPFEGAIKSPLALVVISDHIDAIYREVFGVTKGDKKARGRMNRAKHVYWLLEETV